jgi:phage tail protein X
MTHSYIVTDPKRLDQIVYEVYGDLEQFEEVLEANRELLKKLILEPGDIVRLVQKRKKPEIIEEKALWK